MTSISGQLRARAGTTGWPFFPRSRVAPQTGRGPAGRTRPSASLPRPQTRALRRRASTGSTGSTASTASPNAAKTTKVFVVYGYGCDRFPNDQRARNRTLQAAKHGSIESVELLCNTDWASSMTYDIWTVLLQSRPYLEPTPFVRKVMAKVCDALDAGYEVLLLGHSYGGSVVSRVALFLEQFCPRRMPEELRRLRCVTFGSIFVPPPGKISLTHYAYDNDIARLCSKAGPRCAHVQRLRPRAFQGPLGAHLDYDHLIERLVRGATTNLRATPANLRATPANRLRATPANGVTLPPRPNRKSRVLSELVFGVPRNARRR